MTDSEKKSQAQRAANAEQQRRLQAWRRAERAALLAEVQRLKQQLARLRSGRVEQQEHISR